MTILFRDANGRTKVAAPSADGDAANKKYCDDGFVAKQTGTTTYDQVYVKKADGTQGMIFVSGANVANQIPMYVGQGQLNTGSPTNEFQAVNRGYADTTYVTKDNGTSSYYHIYCKNPDGTQGVINGHTNPLANAVPIYRTGGTLRVGTPSNDADATTKKYVDDAVGQLIYTHSITLGFTVNARSFILNISLLNDDDTAYTSVSGTNLLNYIQNGAYSIITNSYVNSSFWSVMVCPSDKYIHSDTGIGFILTAGADGSTIYVDGIDPSYNTDITSVTISDVVTTW